MTQTDTEEIDLGAVDRIVAQIGRDPKDLVPLLQAIQDAYGYLPRPALVRLAEQTDIAPAAITGVSTFYAQFRHRPAGQHRIRICHGTACHVKGAQTVTDAIHRHLGIPDGDDTNPDRRFTVDKVACLGCCTLAPCMQIGEITYGHLQPDTVGAVLDGFLARKDTPASSPSAPSAHPEQPTIGEIRVGMGSCCQSRGSAGVRDAVEAAIQRLRIPVRIKSVGCVGMCHQTPLLELVPQHGEAALYAGVRADDVEAILSRHFPPPSPLTRWRQAATSWIDRLLFDTEADPAAQRPLPTASGPVARFLEPQRHVALQHCGHLDPVDLLEYRARGGFVALQQCLAHQDPERTLQMLEHSGLRGRGGAGYPTAKKWRHVYETLDAVKYVVMNGDEGDPGAFMDRMLLESYPLRILEGVAIAAWTIGAREAYLYIRHEYPLAVQRIREAIDRATRAGYLGEHVCGTEFALTVRIMEGAGAFVCGEETALLASIEGKRGMPRLRPPYPSTSGLWGHPTLINNAETYANVPYILREGAEAFSAYGTATSRGAKVFALAGKVRNGGLIEVPMGTPIRQIVMDIGGGVEEGRRPKAVQIGGPSGGCIPEALWDIPVDYEALVEHGAIMGSGGLVVLDDTDCMVEIARYFLSFTQNESCGRCTFCRIGTRRMLEILERLCAGESRPRDLETLEALCREVKQGSLCALGGTAPNPVLSTLQHFRDEYEAHVDGRCPAGQCPALIRFAVTDDCIGCTLCAQHCPVDAIAFRPYERHEIDTDLCVRCGMCRNVCPVDAVRVE